MHNVMMNYILSSVSTINPGFNMDLIAISAPDFGLNWGKNGGFWILIIALDVDLIVIDQD